MNKLQIASKGLKVTEFGIEEVGSVSPEEIQSALKDVMRFDTMLQFYIGDLINIATWKWGEKYDKWEEATGYSEKALQYFAGVSTRFSPEFRETISPRTGDKHNVITFTHYKAVAPLSDEKALYFLGMVRDGKWSVAKLIEEVKRDKNGGTLPEPQTYELPDGFAPIAEAHTSSYVPAPEVVGPEKKKVICRLVEITDYEAKIILETLQDNARLVSFCERLETAFGDVS